MKTLPLIEKEGFETCAITFPRHRDLKLFQVSQRIADLYTSTCCFARIWSRWEKGEENHWQRPLARGCKGGGGGGREETPGGIWKGCLF